MTQSKHTPTPWDIEGDHFKDSGIIIRDTDNKLHIAYVTTDGTSYDGERFEIDEDQQEANAAFIVKAVNCHDELVAALTVAYESAMYRGDADVAKVIGQAIAKAKGEV